MDERVRLPADYLRGTASVDDCNTFLARERREVLWLGSAEVAALSSSAFDDDAWVSAADLASESASDRKYVSKMLRALECKGLVRSRPWVTPAGRPAKQWQRIRPLDQIEYEHHGQ